MSAIKNLIEHYKSKAGANEDFFNVIKLIDDVLREKDNIHLEFPFEINDQCCDAMWDYASTLNEDDLDELDEEGVWYFFNHITMGITVTTRGSLQNKFFIYLMTYIEFDGENKRKLALNRYELTEKMDIVKISNDIAAATATIFDLEILISNMESNRREIVMNLLCY